MRYTVFCILALAILITSGCGHVLHTDYTRPNATVPAQWNATSTAPVVADAARWPEDFGDPELERLVGLALERNNDLAAAALRVRQAQLAAGLAYEDLIPGLSATAGSRNEKDLEHGRDWTNSYSARLEVGYEADLWGRLSSAYDASAWEAAATEEDRQSTALSLVGTTMKLYWQIAYLNVRLELSRKNIESSEKTLELVRAQEQYGAASDLEINEARKNLAGLRASRQPLLQERREAVNSLAVLFDMPPGTVMADPQRLEVAALPVIPAGLPAELLGRRPDLRAAEFRLRKLLANTDVARASFYPTLALTGSLGSSSPELVDILENPLAALTTSIALPFLNWKTLRLEQKQARAQYDEAVVGFRQTLYEAMRDVENALSNRRILMGQGVILEENLDAARKVEHTYEVRYKTGYGTLKDWLEAQNSRRAAEESVTRNLYDRLVNFVTLYQALGGEPKDPSERVASEKRGD